MRSLGRGQRGATRHLERHVELRRRAEQADRRDHRAAVHLMRLADAEYVAAMGREK